MPQPSTGPSEPDTFPAVCTHTHLFPGARCRLQGLPDPRAFAARPEPTGVDLQFSDGVATDAELRTGGPVGPVLAVPAYTTGAGTRVDKHTWFVKEFTVAGDEVELAVGSKVDPQV